MRAARDLFQLARRAYRLELNYPNGARRKGGASAADHSRAMAEASETIGARSFHVTADVMAALAITVGPRVKLKGGRPLWWIARKDRLVRLRPVRVMAPAA